jgi:hypothetical protein
MRLIDSDDFRPAEPLSKLVRWEGKNYRCVQFDEPETD